MSGPPCFGAMGINAGGAPAAASTYQPFNSNTSAGKCKQNLRYIATVKTWAGGVLRCSDARSKAGVLNFRGLPYSATEDIIKFFLE